MHLIKIILWQWQTMSEPIFNCLSSKLFEDKSIFRLSRNSISSHRSCSKTFPNCVLAESQLHLIKIILKQFHNMSEQKINCIWSNLFYDKSEMCLRRNSSASHRNYCMSISNCVLAVIQFHPIENILRQFQIVSEPKFKCISSKMF